MRSHQLKPPKYRGQVLLPVLVTEGVIYWRLICCYGCQGQKWLEIGKIGQFFHRSSETLITKIIINSLLSLLKLSRHDYITV